MKSENRNRTHLASSYLEFHGLIVSPCLSPSRKSLSRHQSQPLPPDVIQLRDMVSVFPPSRPFDHLDAIATLGVGGFGRVELVS